MSALHVIVLLNVASTWVMVGVIWLVQLVHYPMFAMVDRSAFAAFHRFHGGRITWIVLPAMTLELVSSALLTSLLGSTLTFIGLGCAVVTWAATASLSVPAHTRLARGFEAAAHDRLVATNWLRTLAFSVHGAISLLLLAAMLRS